MNLMMMPLMGGLKRDQRLGQGPGARQWVAHVHLGQLHDRAVAALLLVDARVAELSVEVLNTTVTPTA